MSRPQTIQIYRPTGDPPDMRVAQITTRVAGVNGSSPNRQS
jgi:hypothetical protein